MATYGQQPSQKGRIDKLEAQVRTLQLGDRMSSSSVDADGTIDIDAGGRITVNDAAGVEQSHLGLVPDGTYGVSSKHPTANQWVSLAQLAFGLNKGVGVPSLVADSKGVWTPDDLNVVVKVQGNRLVIISGARITCATPFGSNAVQGYYGHAVAGPTPQGVDVNNSVRADFSTAAVNQQMWVTVYDGLEPGSYTITGRMMRTTNGSDPVPTVGFSNRTLICIPF